MKEKDEGDEQERVKESRKGKGRGRRMKERRRGGKREGERKGQRQSEEQSQAQRKGLAGAAGQGTFSPLPLLFSSFPFPRRKLSLQRRSLGICLPRGAGAEPAGAPVPQGWGAEGWEEGVDIGIDLP